MRDQVATMLLAGHETTAVALSWSLYLLALAPEAQDRVAQETRGIDLTRNVEIDDLPYTRAVIDETLRLYPPRIRYRQDCKRWGPLLWHQRQPRRPCRCLPVAAAPPSYPVGRARFIQSGTFLAGRTFH